MNYETMTVNELRTEARTRPRLVGAWIASANKSTLIKALKANDESGGGKPQQTLPLPPTTPPTQEQDVKLTDEEIKSVMAKQGEQDKARNAPYNPESPEERILKAIREMIPSQEGGASSAELEAIKDHLHALEEEVGDATVRIHNIEQRQPREIVVTVPEISSKKIGQQHALFDRLLTLVSARVNTFMVGPAGSGKTRAAEAVAEALNLRFYAMSVGPQSTQAAIFGYMDAQGNCVRSLFREAYEHGGVFLMDEIDAGNAAVVTAINQATSNNTCGFPDCMVTKHPDFVFLAAGNTYGRGADRQYVGRTQLDAATLDRFAILNWDYDEKLESAIVQNKDWTKRVQKLRKNVEKNNVRHVISPRASILGERLLAAGLPQEDVEEMLIWKGLDKATREKIGG